MEEINIKPVQDDSANRAVFVSNIAPTATNKTVSEFFAFCGAITSLTMRVQQNSEDKVQEAIIEFKQEAATKTALLLTNALIIDRPISVTRYQGEAHKTEEELKLQNSTVFKEDEIQNKPHDLPASQRTQTSVIASVIAAGYQLAAGSLESAKTYDEKHAITAQIKAGAEGAISTVTAKAAEIDTQYKISETTTAWTQAASAKLSELDKRYGITESANAIAQSAEELVKQVEGSEPVIATTNALKSTGAVIASYADHLGKEATRVIEEKPMLKAASDTILGTTNKVKEEYNAVVEETGRLIKDQSEEKDVEHGIVNPVIVNPSESVEHHEEKSEEKKDT